MSAHSDDLERVLSWLDRLTAERAGTRLTTDGGVALLSPRFPAAHDHNLVVLDSAVTARVAADAADAALGGAGLGHRRLDASRTDADALTPGLEAIGYERSDDVIMAFRAMRPPIHGPHVVTAIDTDERSRIATEGWRREQPGWPDHVCVQLGERVRTLPPDVQATFLAVRGAEGRVDARADLFVRDGIAQLEEIITEPAARNRGLASALVRDAVRRGHDAGVELTFLVADATDGPVALYRRLGFAEIGRKVSFSR